MSDSNRDRIARPGDSSWNHRGFEYSVRLRIYAQMLRANRPSIPTIICEQNPAVTMEQAEAAFQRFRAAAGDTGEGTADWGRFH